MKYFIAIKSHKLTVITYLVQEMHYNYTTQPGIWQCFRYYCTLIHHIAWNTISWAKKEQLFELDTYNCQLFILIVMANRLVQFIVAGALSFSFLISPTTRLLRKCLKRITKKVSLHLETFSQTWVCIYICKKSQLVNFYLSICQYTDIEKHFLRLQQYITSVCFCELRKTGK